MHKRIKFWINTVSKFRNDEATSVQAIGKRGAVRGRFLISAVATLTIVACLDEGPTRMNNGPPDLQAARPRSTVYPAVPGPVPGRYTYTLGYRSSAGNSDTVFFPDTFARTTLVRLSVQGILSRSYNSAINPSLNLAGNIYDGLDSDGEWMNVNNSCAGGVWIRFKYLNVWPYDMSGCRAQSTNVPYSANAASYSVTGKLRGSGYFYRASAGQPTYPASIYCNGLCVVVTGGSQTVTIEPTNKWLNLLATPDSVSEGDDVLFTAVTHSNTPLATLMSWVWVPDWELDSLGNPIGSAPIPVTEPCTNVRVNTYTVTCTLKRYQSGTMYVRADVGAGSDYSIEQANMHVKVTPVGLNVKIDRRFVGRGDSISLTLIPDPLSKSIAAASISGGGATLTNKSCSGAVCKANVQSSGSIVVSALVNGVPKSATVRVDTVKCATGDSIVDNLAVRELLAELDTLSQSNNKTEYGGIVFVDSNWTNPRLKIDTNSANTCMSSRIPSKPLNTRMLVEVHTHPYTLGDSLTCPTSVTGLPSNQYLTYGTGVHGGLPSVSDWHGATTHPGANLIIDNTAVAKYRATLSTLSGSTLVAGVPQPVPDSVEFANQHTIFSRSASGCTWP